MVVAAHQDEVAQVGGAAAGPVPHVVGVAPTGRTAAAGEAAALVAGDDGAAQPGRRGALGAADVDGDASGVGDDPADRGVAEQPVDVVEVDRPGVLPVGAAGRPSGEGGPVDDHADLPAVAPTGRDVLERHLADAHQRVGAALRPRPRVDAVGRLGVGVDGGDDGLGGEVGEVAGQDGTARPARGQVEPVGGARGGAVGLGVLAEPRRGPAQAVQVAGPGQLEQLRLAGGELVVVAFDPGADDGARRSGGDRPGRATPHPCG